MKDERAYAMLSKMFNPVGRDSSCQAQGLVKFLNLREVRESSNSKLRLAKSMIRVNGRSDDG